MGFSVINIAGGSTDSNFHDTVAVTATGAVNAGDLIICWVVWGVDIGSGSVSDGTSTFEVGSLNTGGAFSTANGQFYYLLSSVATGSPTYTWTGVGAYSPQIILEVWRPSAAVLLDTQIATASGSSTSVDSGSIATTGTDELVLGGMYASNVPALSNYAIGGIDASTNAAVSNADHEYAAWYLATTGTVHATLTLDSSQTWLANAIAFKIIDLPAATKCGSLMSMFR